MTIELSYPLLSGIGRRIEDGIFEELETHRAEIIRFKEEQKEVSSKVLGIAEGQLVHALDFARRLRISPERLNKYYEALMAA